MADSKKTLRARVAQAIKRYSAFGKIEEVADNRRHRFNREVKDGRDHAKLVREELGREAGPSVRKDALEQELARVVHRIQRAMEKREFWRNRYVWARERHSHWGLVLKHRRDRIRRWIAQHEDFQPYMANGNPYEKLTPEAKHAIYLDFRDGNYVTATYEGFPGDGVHSTTSGHYLQNQPDGKARCWDAGAGSRGPMETAQRREAKRCPSFLIEMFGPINDLAFKNGIQISLAEGTELEEMHDNHKHTWIRDGAPK